MVKLVIKEKKKLNETTELRTYGDIKRTIKKIVAKKTGKAVGGLAYDKGKDALINYIISKIPGSAEVKLAASLTGGALEVVKAIYDAADDKKTDTILDKLNVDDDYSKIVDDKLEIAFLKAVYNEIMSKPDNELFDTFNINTRLSQYLAANYNNKTLTGTTRR